MKVPQENYTNGATTKDHCQTPPEAVDLIIPYLNKAGIQIIWEPASGEDGLIVQALVQAGFIVHATDIRNGQDFFTYRPDFHFDCILTNPPYSIAHKFIAQANWYKKPWTMLMKSDRAGVGNHREGLFVEKDGLWISDYEQIVPSSRISFKMPNKGWGAHDTGGAQFHTSWYCRHLNIGHFQIVVPYTQQKRSSNIDICARELQNSIHPPMACGYLWSRVARFPQT